MATTTSETDLTTRLPAFDYQPQTRVVFGAGSLAKLGELVRELGGQKVLLVTDPGLQAAGHPERALGFLTSAACDVVVFDQVEENPTTKHVEAGRAFAADKNIDFIVSVGGGSTMDCAKGINFLLTNGGSMADYKGHGKAARPMLPSVSVPTTSGTGSEAQSYALIADAVSHMKMACGDKKAAFRVAVLDPEVTITQPAKLTAVTGIDAMAHAIEAYVCTRRTVLAQTYALSAWRMLEPNLEVVLREPGHLDARAAMQLGANFAGTAIENSMLGATHACANPLTAHYGITHGAAIGILLPHVIRFNARHVGMLYADLVRASSVPEAATSNGDPARAADQLAKRITALVQAAGLPTSLSDAGVSQSILHLLAEEAAEQWTGKFNPRPAGEAELLQIYEASL